MPGVVRVFTAADVPGFRGTGLNDPDQPVFVAEGETTCCVADFLAMVVADTSFHARLAAKQVRIDYDVLEPVIDPFDAMKPEAPLIHSADTFSPRPSNVLKPTTAFTRGDVDGELARAAHVIEAPSGRSVGSPSSSRKRLALPRAGALVNRRPEVSMRPSAIAK